MSLDGHRHGEDEESGGDGDRGDDHAREARRIGNGRFKEHDGPEGQRYDPSHRKEAIAGYLDLGNEENDPQKDQQDAGIIDRQGAEGKEGQNQTDAPDDPREDRPRIGELKVKPTSPIIIRM